MSKNQIISNRIECSKENIISIIVFFYLIDGTKKEYEYLFQDGIHPNTDELAAECYRDAVRKVNEFQLVLTHRKIKLNVGGKWIDHSFKYLPMLKTERGWIPIDVY
ncbi:MAG: hypothetical protein KF856_14270 [Cyclobacteriaceae bacterium]|nr:hypothetical protein [Cyclobacteriaceae bacterium]